jgi:hypothetical protein
MWRLAENLGMDEKPHRLDIVFGPGLDPQEMDHPPAVQALAAQTPEGYILDPGTYVVV